MKRNIKISNRRFSVYLCLVSCLFLLQSTLTAQDSTVVANEKTTPPKPKPAKNTFQSVWIIDNQTVMVSKKGTFEMDIMHRFGTVEKGYDDFWGFFAPSNIRLGVSYAPINRLNVGIGITKSNKLWDASAKYAILLQTKGKSHGEPVHACMGKDDRAGVQGSIKNSADTFAGQYFPWHLL